MKRIFLITLLSLGFIVTAFSQGPPRRMNGEGGDRVKAMRIAYITNTLELTPEESEKFWPIFNEMEQKMRDLRKDVRNNRTEPETDAAAKQAIMDQLAMEQQRLDLEKEYLEKLNEVISYTKLYRLKKAEKDFKRELLKRSRERRRAE